MDRGVPPPRTYDTTYNKTLDIPFDYLTADKKIIKHRHQNEEDYFEADSDEEKANTKALKQAYGSEPEDELEYIPAPDSPSNAKENDSDDDVDPLEAFMSGIEKQANKDLKTSEINATLKSSSKNDKKGIRQDLEDEDIEESYFRYMEENPMAGVAYIDDDFALEYDADGNPIVPEKLKIVDPLPPIDHSQIKYKPFEKNFYQESPDIAQLTISQVQELREKLGIKVIGAQPPKPTCSFAHFGFDSAIMSVLRQYEFTQPTPIQAQGIPVALSGRDLIGIAKTGSGKTLAYLLPMIVHILDQESLKAGQGPIGLILVPTRELCIQVYQEAKRFTAHLSSKLISSNSGNNSNNQFIVQCIYGGGNMWEQQKALESGCDILVATPGRLIDLIKKRALNLEKVTYLVLDEADRMFDLGFEAQVRSITNNVRRDRQTLLFSATFKRKIEKLARDICTDPIKIVQGDHLGQANEDVTQEIKIFVENTGKTHYLIQNLVKYMTDGSVLIFATKKSMAEELASTLNKNDFNVGLLHGDLLQPDRNRILSSFKKGEYPILVATDVAARGLDIPHIKTVINYEIARDIDTHTHRVGRTGRAGQKGLAITFLTQKDKEFAGHLVRNFEGANQPVPHELMELALQSTWFRKTRFGGKWKKNQNFNDSNTNNNSSNNNTYKKPKIGGAGLGYHGPHISPYSKIDSQNYSKTTKSQTSGPGSERLNSIKSAFQNQYTRFKASTEKQDNKWKNDSETPINTIKTGDSNKNLNATSKNDEMTQRKRKSRWE